jgi:Integrase zinc binding domain
LGRYVADAATSEDHSAEIKESHIQTGHRFWKALYVLIKRALSRPNMQQDIWRIARSCPVCICYNNVTTKNGNKLSPIQTITPNKIVCIDNMGPIGTWSGGYKYYLVGIAHSSNAETVIPTAIINAEVSIHFIDMPPGRLGQYSNFCPP